MFARHVFRTGQVGNRPRHFQNPVVSSRAEIQFRHRHLQHLLRRVVERAECFQLLWPDARVAGDFWFVRETFLLPLARSDDARSDFRRILAGFVAGNFTKFYLGHFDMQINSVEQRPRNSSQIVLNFARRTLAFMGHFSVWSARCCLFMSAE